MRDLISNIKTNYHWAKTVSADETPAAGIDLQGFYSALVQVAVGTVTNAAPGVGWTLHLQHSDDNSTFTDVLADDVIMDHGANDTTLGASGKFATVDDVTGDDAVFTVGYLMTKRYVRVLAVAVGVPGATPIAAVVASGNAALKPVND